MPIRQAHLPSAKAKLLLQLLCVGGLLLLLLPLESRAVNISSCQALSSPNTYYQVINNLSATDGCLNITVDNITLNCQGYKINASTDGLSGASAIDIYGNNAVVGNCSVYYYGADGMDIYGNNASVENNSVFFWKTSSETSIQSEGGQNLSITNNTAQSISLDNTNNTLISGNLVHPYGGQSISSYADYFCSNTTVVGNTVSPGAKALNGGVEIECSNSLIENNIMTLVNGSSDAFYSYNFFNSTFSNNTLYATGDTEEAIEIDQSTNFTIANNTETVLEPYNQAPIYGLYLSQDDNATINGNNYTLLGSEAQYPYYLWETYDTQSFSNSLYSNSTDSFGLVLDGGSSNDSFYNNTIEANNFSVQLYDEDTATFLNGNTILPCANCFSPYYSFFIQGNSTLNFLNNSYDASTIGFNDNSSEINNATVEYLIQANTTDQSYDAIQAQVQVSLNDSQQVMDEATNSSGLSSWQPFPAWSWNDSVNQSTLPLFFNASQSGYDPNSTYANFTQSSTQQLTLVSTSPTTTTTTTTSSTTSTTQSSPQQSGGSSLGPPVDEQVSYPIPPTSTTLAQSAPASSCTTSTTLSTTPIPQRNCADGTPSGACSASKPQFCENGLLVAAPSTCGCPAGYSLSKGACSAPTQSAQSTSRGGLPQVDYLILLAAILLIAAGLAYYYRQKEERKKLEEQN